MTEIDSNLMVIIQFLLEPYEYLTQRTGKRIRTKLMEVLNHSLKKIDFNVISFFVDHD